MAREALSDDERWRLWWDEDFSWAGLAKRNWLGWRIDANGAPVPESELNDEDAQSFRQATLQDYWHDEKSALIDEYDEHGHLVRRWTKVHLPPAFHNGAPTGKQSHTSDILDIVAKRLAAAAETPGQYGENDDMIRWWPDHEDRRAMLEGAVLPSLIASDLVAGPIHVRLSGAVILGKCDFKDASFGMGAEFHYTRFLGDSQFKNATFDGVCAMGFSQFKRNAEFGGSHFKGRSEFLAADFEADCAFDKCNFEGEAQFTMARVQRTASFGDAHFHQQAFLVLEIDGNASFSRCTFAGRTYAYLECEGRCFFDYSRFLGVTEFGSSIFNGPTRFVDVEFPQGALPMRRAFRSVTFKDQVDFSGAGAHWTYGLHGANIEANILLDDVGANTADAITQSYLKAISRKETIAALESRATPYDAPITRELLLREFEDSCRVLKSAMGRLRNEILEQRYYRYQLIARRRQASAPLWERLLSLLYAAFGDYGNSMFRPMAALAISVAAFGVLFFGWCGTLGFAHGQADNHLLEAMKFSLANTFRPLSTLDAQGDFKGAVGHMLSSDTWWSFWLKVVAVLQSLLALALAFLFGLAVRRRFQMH